MSSFFWKDKNVLLTGHTGFKGGWLTLWLTSMGARVHGFSLPAESKSFYHACKLKERLASEELANLSDLATLNRYVHKVQPDIVFHLAAQSLVRVSYRSPVETFATNVMGTVHLLETLRNTPTVKSVVNITSDKCYENREDGRAYQEQDVMGGHDPYSASKGCAELVTASYRRSFNLNLASARAGNVIGGGDWSEDRLVPDFLKAWDEKRSLVIRSQGAVRPWQHVLEPLSGYLLLAEKLQGQRELAQGWNFGPDENDTKTVEWVANELTTLIPGSKWERDGTQHPHEAKLLSLNSQKAREGLGWNSRWDVKTALLKTAQWHLAWKEGADMRAFSLKQIGEYRG